MHNTALASSHQQHSQPSPACLCCVGVAAHHGGRILVARESAAPQGSMLADHTTGELVDMWEAVASPDAVQTPAEVYASLAAEGLAVRYLRVPVTDGRAPQPCDIDAIIKQVGGQEVPLLDCWTAVWESNMAVVWLNMAVASLTATAGMCIYYGTPADTIGRHCMPRMNEQCRSHCSASYRKALLVFWLWLLQQCYSQRGVHGAVHSRPCCCCNCLQVRTAGFDHPMVFNCQMGAGRTTTGTVIGGLLAMYGSTVPVPGSAAADEAAAAGALTTPAKQLLATVPSTNSMSLDELSSGIIREELAGDSPRHSGEGRFNIAYLCYR